MDVALLSIQRARKNVSLPTTVVDERFMGEEEPLI